MFIQFPEVHTPIQGMENVPIPNIKENESVSQQEAAAFRIWM